MKKLTRKDFLRGAAAGLVGVSAIGFTGMSAVAAEAGEEIVVAESLNADVVVVGSGPAGVAAAMEALEGGAKNVVLLEKSSRPGGKALIADGILGIQSSLSIANGVTLNVSEMLKAWLEETEYMCDGALAYKFFDLSGETVDWLIERGIDFVHKSHGQIHEADAFETYHYYADTSRKLEYFNAFVENFQKKGGVYLTETPAFRLLTKEDKICGILARRADDSVLQINTPVVILSTGGFCSNDEMMRKYSINPIYQFYKNGLDTGDGAQMSWEIGAAEGKTIQEMHGLGCPMDMLPNGDPRRTILTAPLRSVAALWVNSTGLRFVDETISLDSAFSSNAGYVQGDFFAIFDSKSISVLEAEGGQGLGIDVSAFTNVITSPVDQPWEGLRDALESAEETGATFKADTISALAEKLNVDAYVLEETVKSYNAACAEGVDKQFAKKSKYLIPVEESPYFAIRVRGGTLGGIGGLKVDSNLNVLFEDGNKIGGLYATGNDVATIYNNSYPAFEGASFGFAFNSGRLAAKDALNYLKN